MVAVGTFLGIARKYVGVKEGSSQHKAIIDAYNAHKPLAVGYKVKLTDDWCDAFVSKVAIEAGITGSTGTECGVDRHIGVFKKHGIWNENGSVTPKPGDIITYNWNDSTQGNDGFADHIGIVEGVSRGVITTIEGNYGNAVTRRAIRVGHGNIRGFARPVFTKTAPNVVVESPKSGVTHKVVSGDNLWDIARHYNTDVSTIKSLSGLKSDVIQPGQVLTVKAASKTYTVKAGDSLSAIGNRLNISWTILAKNNNIKSPYVIKVGQQIKY